MVLIIHLLHNIHVDSFSFFIFIFPTRISDSHCVCTLMWSATGCKSYIPQNFLSSSTSIPFLNLKSISKVDIYLVSIDKSAFLEHWLSHIVGSRFLRHLIHFTSSLAFCIFTPLCKYYACIFLHIIAKAVSEYFHEESRAWVDSQIRSHHETKKMNLLDILFQHFYHVGDKFWVPSIGIT